ncbi:hypothetical protein ACWKSP_00835 [Micromonosporaceae bacterium Da 78-11]
MTERVPADRRSIPSGLHFQISKLLVVAVAAATSATGALVVAVLVDWPSFPPPPPPGANGMGPPPPDMESMAVFPIVTGFFVLTWLAVLVIFCRDQVLLHLRQQHEASSTPGPDADELTRLLADLRTELAVDRERELEALGDRLAEFAEQRETDGYLRGMRNAASTPTEANVRNLRRTPPQR